MISSPKPRCSHFQCFIYLCVPLVSIFRASCQPTVPSFPSQHGTSVLTPTATPPFAMLLPLCSRTAPKFRFDPCGDFFFIAVQSRIPDMAFIDFHWCVQDELASMMADGRLKVIVESEYPFTQQGVTDMCLAPRKQPAALHRCLPHALVQFCQDLFRQKPR